MDFGLRGKVAVVTGGSVGIGLAVAEGLAAEGSHVILAARDLARARSEAERIATQHDIPADAAGCDLATAEVAQTLID